VTVTMGRPLGYLRHTGNVRLGQKIGSSGLSSFEASAFKRILTKISALRVVKRQYHSNLARDSSEGSSRLCCGALQIPTI